VARVDDAGGHRAIVEADDRIGGEAEADDLDRGGGGTDGGPGGTDLKEPGRVVDTEVDAGGGAEAAREDGEVAAADGGEEGGGDGGAEAG